MSDYLLMRDLSPAAIDALTLRLAPRGLTLIEWLPDFKSPTRSFHGEGIGFYVAPVGTSLLWCQRSPVRSFEEVLRRLVHPRFPRGTVFRAHEQPVRRLVHDGIGSYPDL